MDSQQSSHNSCPPNLFSQGQLRDPNLKNILQSVLTWPSSANQQMSSPTSALSSSSTTDLPASISTDHLTGMGSSLTSPSLSLQPWDTAKDKTCMRTNDNADKSDSDTEMADARSNFDEVSYTDKEGHDQSQNATSQHPLGSIKNLFRLLDLVDEHGSGGIVEKVVIDQTSLHRVLNIIQPGSYDSVSKINFKALDRLSIKPTGIYGNRSEIVKFLSQVQYFDENSVSLLSRTSSPHDSATALRSGLYVVLDPSHKSKSSPKSAYIVYWPEDTTWDDQAASSSVRRNRVTFIRYLTKLSDQIIALVSPSQAESFVWDTNPHNKDLPEDQQDNDDDSRLFSFEVTKSLEQEEDAVGSDGFVVSVESNLLPRDKEISHVQLVPGEQKMALLTRQFESAQTHEKRIAEKVSSLNLRHMICAKDCPLQLGDLKPIDIELLSSNGLRESHKGVFEAHEQRLRVLNEDRSASERDDKKFIEDRISADKPKIKEEVKNALRVIHDRVYPALKFGYDIGHGPEVTAELHRKYSGLGKLEDEIRKKYKMEQVQDKQYQFLKSQWLFVEEYFDNNPKLPRSEQDEFVNDVLNGATLRVDKEPTPKERASRSGVVQLFGRAASTVSTVLGLGGNHQDTAPKLGSSSRTNASRQAPDPEFVAHIHTTKDSRPALAELLRRIQTSLGQNLESIEKKVLADQLDKIVSGERSRQATSASKARDEIYNQRKRESFERLMVELKEATVSNAPTMRTVHSVRQTERHGYNHNNAGGSQYHWDCTITSLQPAQYRYMIYPLEITEQDSHRCRANEFWVPQPKLDTRHRFEFALQRGRSVEFIQLIRDKCLVITSESDRTRIYIEDNVTLDHSINTTHGKVTLSHDSLGGSKCKFALDQATRLLAIVHGQKGDLKLSIYIFDELFANLRSRGSPIPLRNWYNQPVDIERVCFVSGIEDVCLIEASGRVRIFSLVTQQFRNALLQIDQPIVDAFSAPDGSCLLVAVADGESSTAHQLLAFHWASFGINKKGIKSATLLPCDGPRTVTRFEGRGRVHVVSFSENTKTITSTVLQITQKATEFSFRSDHEKSHGTAAETVNNSLIDCHLEVWTRFPVVPAVARNTLVAINRQPRQLNFISQTSLDKVEEYFARMISTFEMTTRKPMGGNLASIEVKSIIRSEGGGHTAGQISEFKLGSFIVELLCLIPLHLAVTRENRFIPLKDGVWDPDYERSLLGADVPAIVDALSLGWYESLFQSYMAKKPIRVVSSMGEQSVGKSYCLNHFADTSFAGSAMRTTEGVWLSCTPTEKYLLVSLDFEGVHSIERSAQEDALLVLFNTAISNLVLFRNNFAMSRDIAGLFTSFQSSATVLDPNVNRGLFNSTLAIIIKDVTSADSNDIVKEFSLKFQTIVEKEKDQNFITRLHRGRIQIIPWPVINSPGFYRLFNRLHQKLDEQSFTHRTGGAFLHSLKTLMAKIKTSDWGSLDQNLAAHRAQQLMERLPNALCYGREDEGPLRNMDTDDEFAVPENIPPFFVPEFSGASATENEALVEQALYLLIYTCGPPVHSRYQVPDTEYVETLQSRLYELLDQRLLLVEQWMSVNIERFPSGNQDIRSLSGKLNTASLAMRASVQLCSSGCSECQLLCLRAYRHSGDHSCGTNHRCVSSCEIAGEHLQQEPCGLPAGHRGRHMCNVKTHSCGQECHLSQMGGCLRSCLKPLGHGGDHVCSARVHLCGKPCDLRDAKQGNYRGLYSCPGTCDAPWDKPHRHHACENSRACPIECILCRRLCCSTDHFHGLNSGAAHLCGQEHNCAHLCEADGICQIETRPSAIQDQFSGRHESFVYTRYTQVDRRLSCVVPVPPGELEHNSPHTHDTDEDAFHFCDARCPNCEYLCILPLGHGQQLHETSHGSMTTTRWVLQPDADDEDAAYELQGRKFGSGDEGAPMLCSLVCAAQGRHAHIDFCRDPGNCSDTDCEHITERMHPDPDRPKDWISHATYWARSGFKDPYSQDEQNEFLKCDVLCAGPEHEATTTTAANPSHCTLPMFHPPEPQQPVPPAGHVSRDGHAFNCQNPSRLHQAYHIVFVIDSSGSMTETDRAPLSNTPISARLVSSCNNRYGAVLSALYGFWLSRDTAAAASTTQARQDAYSVITFDHYATTRFQNDFTSTTDELTGQLIPQMGQGGTNFQAALTMAQSLIEANWSSDRAPVIIFLSDGECNIVDNPVYDLCHPCVRLGKALAFHSVSFGTDTYSASLRRMADIAHEVFASAPQDVLTAARGNPCAYTNAIDSIQLADTFLGIANSLQKPRASLMNQYGSGGRRAMY